MGNLDDKQQSDDHEVELIPLDPPGAANSAPLPRWLVFTRMSLRWRMAVLRTLLALSLVLLAILVVPGSLPAVQRMMRTIFNASQPPVPTPGALPGAVGDDFYMDVSSPWTRVFVDGRPIHLPRIDQDGPLKLANGTHLITWLAEPFPPQACRISLPSGAGDTCRFAPAQFNMQALDPFAQILLLHNSFAALPLQRQGALTAAIQRSLATASARQQLQPGEMYAASAGFVKVTQPLQATLHFNFDPQAVANPPYTIAGEGCLQLCIVPWQYLRTSYAAPAGAGSWFALAFISSSWSYATRDGRVIASNIPLDFANAARGTYPIMLRITWQAAAWQVVPLIGAAQVPPLVVSSGVIHEPATPTNKIELADDPACVAARDLLSWIIYSGVAVRFIFGPNPAAGCVGVIFGSGPGASTSSPAVAYFYEHFGVLLAVNPAAHKLLPGIPVANSYERSLAGRIARTGAAG